MRLVKRSLLVVGILLLMTGVVISLQQKLVNAATPTFSKDVSRIFQSKCQSCHHPGDIAPFSLMTYGETKRWVGAIKDAVIAKRMPPWKPVSGCGDFRDVRQLTEAEITTITQWADGGAPEGDPADLPTALSFPDGWALGEPDLIIQPDEEYTPPKDRDMYRCFTVPTSLRGDRFIQAIDVRAGNKKLVHHVIAYTDPDNASKALDDKDLGPGYTSFGGPGYTNYGMLGGWAPGARPFFNPDGIGAKLDKNSRVVFQVHYHPCQTSTCGQGSPKEETDRTQIGIYYAKAPVSKTLQYLPLVNTSFAIPAGNNNYRVTASFTTPLSAKIINMTPHMHLLGKNIKVEMTVPGKTTPDCLVNIDQWDFRWQGTYTYQTPITLPVGGRLNLTTYFDNSTSNPNNPNTPPKIVRWGEETTDEMALAFIGFTLDSETLATSAPRLDEVSVDQSGNLVTRGANLLPGADIEINGKRLRDTTEKTAAELTSSEMWKVYAAPGSPVNIAIINPDGARTANLNFTRPGTTQPSKAVSAASYNPDAPVTPDGIVSIFGANMATGNEGAQSFPLPTTLAGSTVRVNGMLASLFFVSKEQINFLLPPDTQPGTAIVEVISADGAITRCDLPVRSTSPAIFTENQRGTDAPAADATPDGKTYYRVGSPDGSTNPVMVGHYLQLYGTGFRAAAFDTVTVTLGGKEVPVLYAGKQPQFSGLDQLNVQVPTGLSGVVDLILTVDGRAANTVKIRVQ
ncbi:MAG: hypothetical protein JNM09_27210 [Blastocatellia bacterium]|nr:hypothetical protein [Blastocatellia bacterium]